MKCFACKNGIMEKGVSTYTAQTSNCVIIIKNVPCMKCLQCGEVLYQTDILKKIEEIVKKWCKSLAVSKICRTFALAFKK